MKNHMIENLLKVISEKGFSKKKILQDNFRSI